MPEQPEEQKNRNGIKWLSYQLGGRRISSILVTAMIGGLFIFGFKWSWNVFNDYYCWKCFIPTVILTSSISLGILAIINEIIKFLIKIIK